MMLVCLNYSCQHPKYQCSVMSGKLGHECTIHVLCRSTDESVKRYSINEVLKTTFTRA